MKMDRTINVAGRSMYKAPADLTRVTLDIEGTNRTYEGAIRTCADNGREIKDRLESIGLRRESLKTVSQTVKPHYKEISYRDVDGDKTYKRVKDGFEFSNVLRFEFPNDNEILAKAMGSMMAATCQPDVRISFLNSDPVRCREAAIADAAKDARRKAEILAEAMGCRLGPLMDVSYGTQMSRDRYENDGFALCCASATEDLDLDIDPEDVTFNETVDAVWGIVD